MTEKYDYSVPLNEMPMRHMIHSYDVKSWLEDNYDTIVHALKLAEKVTGEPSEGVLDALEGALYAEVGHITMDDLPATMDIAKIIYLAGITQAQKEIDDE